MKPLVYALIATQLMAATVPDNQGKQPPLKPPAGSSICPDGNAVILVTSCLYWQTRMTDSWITTDSKSAVSGGIATRSHQKAMKFESNPGFKLGMGVRLKGIGWSTFANWTYIHTHPHKSWHSWNHSLSNVLGRPVTEAVQSPSALGNLGANQVSADWALTFNSIDLDIGKDFQIAKSVFQRVFGGLKIGMVDSRLNVDYLDLLDPLSVRWPDEHITMKNWSLLVGPRVGFNNAFGIVGDFGIWVNLGTSVLVLLDNPKYTGNVFNSAGVPIGVKTSHPKIQLSPTFDLYVGFNWGHCFDAKVYVDATVGYSLQYFTQAINALQSLNLYGWTATTGVVF